MREDLHQVADVQAGRGRVEAAIERDGTVRERLAQSVLVSGQGEQPRHFSSSTMSVTVLVSPRWSYVAAELTAGYEVIRPG